jgi:hypothetical protein
MARIIDLSPAAIIPTPSAPTVAVHSRGIGSIQCVSFAEIVDGETFTINDGVNGATVFEFDVVGLGVTPGNVQVDITGAVSAADVAAIVKIAIDGEGLDLAVVDAGTGLLNLTLSATGQTLVAITETVSDVDFVVAGFVTGATSYSYKIVAHDAQGGTTAASSAGSTAAGPAALASTDFNRVTWTDPANAVTILVYRTVGGVTQGLIATLDAGVQTLDDTGLAGDSGTAPSTRAQVSYPADVSALREKMVEVSGSFVGTYQIQGSVGGSLWTDEGSAFTGTGVATIDKAWPMLRAKQTAYTSGTPVIKISGHEER